LEIASFSTSVLMPEIEVLMWAWSAAVSSTAAS
jgi:hypothetical protein